MIVKARPTDFLTKPITAEAVDRIVTQRNREQFEPDELRKAYERLTDREREVLELVVAGASSGKIGAKLAVSSKTIEAHRGRMSDKARTDNISDLTLKWRAWTSRNDRFNSCKVGNCVGPTSQ